MLFRLCISIAPISCATLGKFLLTLGKLLCYFSSSEPGCLHPQNGTVVIHTSKDCGEDERDNPLLGKSVCHKPEHLSTSMLSMPDGKAYLSSDIAISIAGHTAS